MRIVAAFLVGCSLAACGGGSTTAPGGQTGSTFTASVDGAVFASTQTQTSSGSAGNQIPGLITITGTQIVSATDYTTLTLSLGYIAGPGTYPLGVNTGSTAGGIGTVTRTQGVTIGLFSTNMPGNAGTVIVTELTSSRIKGTFSFTAPPQRFSTTTGAARVVTNGAFDVPLPLGFVAATGANPGSKISAIVGGTAWNGATVNGLGSGGSVVIGGTTDTLSVTITPGTVYVAGNTYPIGGPMGALMTVTRLNATQSWNSVSASPVGSITIQTLTSARVTGIFSATLAGAQGGSALSVTQGSFSVRIDPP